MRATANAMNSARRFRRNLSLPEQLLWRLLKQMRGYLRFRRQHPIGPYVADFYCPKARLVIEIDGGAKNTRTALDILPRHSRERGNPAPSNRPVQWRKADILGEITPVWIGRLDQLKLPVPRPLLDPFFAQDGAVHRRMLLEPDQQLDAMFAGEAGDVARAMLMDAGHDLGRDTDVQRAVAPGSQ